MASADRSTRTAPVGWSSQCLNRTWAAASAPYGRERPMGASTRCFQWARAAARS